MLHNDIQKVDSNNELSTQVSDRGNNIKQKLDTQSEQKSQISGFRTRKYLKIIIIDK